MIGRDTQALPDRKGQLPLRLSYVAPRHSSTLRLHLRSLLQAHHGPKLPGDSTLHETGEPAAAERERTAPPEHAGKGR